MKNWVICGIMIIIISDFIFFACVNGNGKCKYNNCETVDFIQPCNCGGSDCPYKQVTQNK